MSTVTRKRSNKKIQQLSITAIMAALIVVMSFTPLGYLKIGQVISITFIPIPVVIGAIISGPATGAILGTVFGITSLIQCFGLDPFGTALMSINPILTVILCLLPRILMGLCSGLIFKALNKKLNNTLLSYSITSFSGGLLNTVFFVGLLVALFGNSDYLRNFGDSIVAIIGTLVTFNAVIEWIACLIIGTAVAKAISGIIKSLNK